MSSHHLCVSPSVKGCRLLTGVKTRPSASLTPTRDTGLEGQCVGQRADLTSFCRLSPPGHNHQPQGPLPPRPGGDALSLKQLRCVLCAASLFRSERTFLQTLMAFSQEKPCPEVPCACWASLGPRPQRQEQVPQKKPATSFMGKPSQNLLHPLF